MRLTSFTLPGTSFAQRSKSKKKPFVSCRLASPSPASWFLSDFWVPDVSSIFFFFWKRTSFGLLTFPFPHFISSPVCRRGEGGLSDLLPLVSNPSSFLSDIVDPVSVGLIVV
jgi:hypothetical protein